MIMSVVSKPVDIGQGLPMTLIILVLGLILALIWTMRVLRMIKGRRRSAEIIRLEIIRLIQKWSENGTAILNWVEAHHKELAINKEADLSHPEFQELLWKDFEIYNRLVILDPKLKENPMITKHRNFYGSLIRTENQRPS